MMNKSVEKRFLIYLLICFAGAFVIGSCTSGKETSAIPSPTLAPEYMDLSWKTEQACPYPCWYGLEVGQSTNDDFLELVDTLSFLRGVDEITTIEDSEFYRDGKIHEYSMVPCKINPKEPCVYAYFTSEVLEAIETHLNYDLTIAEVVAENGPPDYWCPSSLHPEMKASQVYWVWINRGFIMLHEGKDDLFGKKIRKALRSDLIMPGYLPIDKIFYRLPEELEWDESRCQWEWMGLTE